MHSSNYCSLGATWGGCDFLTLAFESWWKMCQQNRWNHHVTQSWHVSHFEVGCNTASHLRQCVTDIATGVTLEVALIQFQNPSHRKGESSPSGLAEKKREVVLWQMSGLSLVAPLFMNPPILSAIVSGPCEQPVRVFVCLYNLISSQWWC